jgi:acyl-CoA thioesterase
MTDFAVHPFDGDTTADAAGAFRLTDRWNALAGINGGYMLATCVRALGQAMPFPDPLVVSGFFLRPGTVGPAEIPVSMLRAGRTTAFGEATLVQGGKQVLRITGAFSTLGGDGPSYSGSKPPSLPPPDECVAPTLRARSPELSISEQVEYRAVTLPGWVTGQPSGNPVSEFWIRLSGGREPDLWSLPLLVDAAPPAVMELGVLSTTIELTVHLRARPAPGWLACRAATSHLAGGYYEEDFEIWDSAGALVAQSRQLALVLR